MEMILVPFCSLKSQVDYGLELQTCQNQHWDMPCTWGIATSTMLCKSRTLRVVPLYGMGTLGIGSA